MSPLSYVLLPATIVIAFANFASTATSGQPGKVARPSAAVRNGTYYGLHSEDFDQDFFLGIPYAQQPVGDLRLQTPQSMNTSWTVARNATEYSPVCVGPSQIDGSSEACLTLNVVRPANVNPHENLPVAVWIHGGGFISGSSAESQYNLSFIVDQSVQMGKPTVAVSLNYRLHCWGFMWSKEIKEAGAANLGFRDQRLALHWIQENIAAFGGNPSQVTIWGESAGANSVGTHLVAYGGRDDGLFRAAISESGASSVYSRYQEPADWQPYYDAIVKASGCSTATDTLACLRTVPIHILQDVFGNTSIVPSHTLSGTTGPQFIPVIDGDFIEESATVQLRKGKFVKVPYIIGGNLDEGTSFSIRGINTDSEFRTVVKAWGLNSSTTDILESLYPDVPEIGIPSIMVGRPPSGYGDQYKRVAAFQGDVNIHAPRRLTSQIWSAHNVSLYSYSFDLAGASSSSYDPYAGADHGSEMPFVFHNVDAIKYGGGKMPTDGTSAQGKPHSYLRLGTIMSRMWISFVTTLDPNHCGETRVHWPAYDAEQPEIVFFDINHKNLLYVDSDIYRAEGIKFISDHLASDFGR
ncbi:uncharacterized protein N7469_008438 [Penicillium citrinum]|uniref:Carboxylic ester hydrolase n=1 Tax=Penicillium citrinum TaxID=5077 RepID=A0A9W9TGV3_PENCI|nr:uncharacterized protein N7469_008438 [Penicillium citrinum]KAJ5222198.1 hypothetical protein N7469_008438 [Penicillium citrinum]